MNERPWQMFLMSEGSLGRHEGDRMLEKAGLASRLSYHATQEEARAAAEITLRKLKKVTDAEWATCYVQPFELGVGRAPGDPFPRVRAIRSSDIDD